MVDATVSFLKNILFIIFKFLFLTLDNQCQQSPSPCKNNGVCTPIGNSFSCVCTAGFTGNTCSQSKSLWLLFVIVFVSILSNMIKIDPFSVNLKTHINGCNLTQLHT